MAGYNPYATNSYQGTQMFPQPQGNVYTLNNSMEIANIPVSGGISVGICPSENLMCSPLFYSQFTTSTFL